MSEENRDGLIFAQTMTSLDSRMAPMSDCENYGMTFGCGIGCPQLRRGDCPVPEENKNLIDELKEEGVL